jgi:hypothetical protein
MSNRLQLLQRDCGDHFRNRLRDTAFFYDLLQPIIVRPLRSLCILTAIGLAALAPAGNSFAQEKPPEELYSPDQRYSVRILHSALPGSDPYDGFFTIAVRSGKQYVAKYRTEGYLIDAFWSPDGRYVTVDNRRANSGDYLWVFRLPDGRSIKMPVDAQPQHADDVYEKYAEEVVHRVTAVYPELTYDQFRKLFVFAHRWTKTGELQVKTNLAFRNLENAIAVVWETYKIENDKLVLVDRKIEKSPWPPPKA